MKNNILTLLSLFFVIFFVSCEKNEQKEKLTSDKNEYAVNFLIKENKNSIYITSAQNTFSVSKEKKIKRCIINCTSASAYLYALNKENTIVGVSSPEYFFNPDISKKIKENKIQNIGNDAYLDVEKIIALKPDIIITPHNSNFENSFNQLKKQGIKIFYLEEYLEFNPLGKTEYLKVFGKIFDAEDKANKLFNTIKYNYLQLKEQTKNAQSKPKIFANIMYGDSWYMPGGKSFVAQYFKDAGADYIWKDTKETGTIPLTFEEVFVKAQQADFWVGISNISSKKMLLNSNINYKQFGAYKKGNLYNINKRENSLKANDYYESGVIYANLALKDLIKIFHPELLPNYQLYYLKKLD